MNDDKVWDPLIRLGHWLLAAAFLTAYFTREFEYELHRLAGYTVLGVVLWRILWGFVGSRHARFRDFVRSPRVVAGYLAGLARFRPDHYRGHNPAGGIMILVLLAVLLSAALSGIALDGSENRAGPLGDTRIYRYHGPIETVHYWSSEAAFYLTLIHLAGVLVTSLLHRENLVGAMITGRRSRRPAAPGPGGSGPGRPDGPPHPDRSPPAG